MPSSSLKTALPRSICVLNGKEGLEPVFALHQKVRAEMPESRRHFLLPRSREYFRDLVEKKGGLLFGASDNDALVGSLALLRRDSFEAAHAAGLLTCPDTDGRLRKKHGEGAVGIIQSMGVLSAYLGRGVSNALLEAALLEAAHEGCKHVFAQIAAHNTLSWFRFLAVDFALIATWTSGHRRFLLRHLPTKERERLQGRAKKQSFSKSYGQLPALLIQLTTQLEQGHIIFLNNTPEESGTLNSIIP